MSQYVHHLGGWGEFYLICTLILTGQNSSFFHWSSGQWSAKVKVFFQTLCEVQLLRLLLLLAVVACFSYIDGNSSFFVFYKCFWDVNVTKFQNLFSASFHHPWRWVPLLPVFAYPRISGHFTIDYGFTEFRKEFHVDLALVDDITAHYQINALSALAFRKKFAFCKFLLNSGG